MTIMWGKVHKYLGMTIDHSSPGKVILWMIDYIGKMIDYIPSDMKGESSKPTTHQLFYIVQDLTKLYQADADLFPPFCSTTTIYFEEGTSIHEASSISPVY